MLKEQVFRQQGSDISNGNAAAAAAAAAAMVAIRAPKVKSTL